jgi:hypothetical protein
MMHLQFIVGFVYICTVMTSVIQQVYSYCFVTVSTSVGLSVNLYMEVNKITITIKKAFVTLWTPISSITDERSLASRPAAPSHP